MSHTALPYLKIPTVPTEFITQLVDVVGNLGVDLQQQLANISSQKKVSGQQYIQFVEAIQSATDDEMFGVFDKQVPIGSSDALCHMLRYSPDLHQALENYCRFYALFSHQQQAPVSFEKSRRDFIICVNISNPKQQHPYFSYTILLQIVKLICWLTGQRVSAKVLGFSFDLSALDDEFTYLFGLKPRYGTAQSYIQFDSTILDYPIAPTISTQDYIKQRMSYLLIWAVTENLERRVYALIAEGIAAGEFDQQRIAAHFNVSRHTLARRLREQGSSYSTILERVRKDKALYLLASTQLGLEQIASQLGFSDGRTFNRAFKEWTNKTPLEYRNLHQSVSSLQ